MPSIKFHFSRFVIGSPELLEALLDELDELLDELKEPLDDDELLVDSSPAPPQPARETAQHSRGAKIFIRMSYPEKVR